MSFEPVDIVLKDKTGMANPVPGVTVRLMNQQGSQLISQATTDSNGVASFLLPSDFTYQLRFYKPHVNFQNPQYITVLTAPVPPQSNIFDISCDPFVPPISTDPRLCVASGFFRRPDGSPAANVDIHFIAKFDPILLDGDAMLVERVLIRTDATGYAQVSLVRLAQYDVTVQGFEDTIRIINVPDALTTNLPDLLFPVVQAITFTPAPPATMHRGDVVYLTPTVISSDGRILEGTATGDVGWGTSDLNVLGVAVNATQVILTGIDPGTATVNIVRLDQTIIRIPATPILGTPIQVTVV